MTDYRPLPFLKDWHSILFHADHVEAGKGRVCIIFREGRGEGSFNPPNHQKKRKAPNSHRGL